MNRPFLVKCTLSLDNTPELIVTCLAHTSMSDRHYAGCINHTNGVKAERSIRLNVLFCVVLLCSLLLLCAQDIERAYNSNPYHNNIHAADVTQTLGCFLANDHFAQKLTDLEVAAMIFATCIHDVGHPGAAMLTPA